MLQVYRIFEFILTSQHTYITITKTKELNNKLNIKAIQRKSSVYKLAKTSFTFSITYSLKL